MTVVPIASSVEAYTPAWWLDVLEARFTERPERPRSRIGDSRRFEFPRNEWLDYLWNRYTGEGAIPDEEITNQKYVEATRKFLRLSKTNFAALIVDSLQDRTQFTGVKTESDSNADGNAFVRQFLEENGTFFADALTFAYTFGEGYVLVGEPDEPGGVPVATAEDPRDIAAAYDPRRPGRLRAAVKRWEDELGDEYRTLWLRSDTGQVSCYLIDPDSQMRPVDVPGNTIPLVPLLNKYNRGEFEPHLDLIDRITNGISDRLWTAKFQAFIQRGIKSNKLPRLDEDGREIDYNDVFASDPGALWVLPDDADLWESRQVDLNTLLAAVKDDIKELSASSRTPLQVFSPEAAAGSAEGASLSREGLTFKAKDRINRFTSAAIAVARLALLYGGQQVQGPLKPIWDPINEATESEKSQSALAASQSGMPWEMIMTEIWGLSDDQMVTARRLHTQEQLLGGPQPNTVGPARAQVPELNPRPTPPPTPAPPPSQNGTTG